MNDCLTAEYCFLVSVVCICIYVGVGTKYNRFNCHRQMRKDMDEFNENVVVAMDGGQFPDK